MVVLKTHVAGILILLMVVVVGRGITVASVINTPPPSLFPLFSLDLSSLSFSFMLMHRLHTCEKKVDNKRDRKKG